MLDVLRDPALQSMIPPLVAALVMAGVLRAVGGSGAGARIAGASIVFGFLVSYYLILGFPPLPPATSSHRIFYVAAAAGGFGFLLDLWAAPLAVARVAAAFVPAVGVAWIGQSGFYSGDMETLGTIALVALASFLALPRLAAKGVSSAESAAMIVVAAAALSGIAIFGASASLAQLAAALAAAAGGFAVWNWPQARYPFGAAAAAGAGAALIAIVGTMVLYTDAHPFAVFLVLPVFYAVPVANAVPLGGAAAVLRPVVVGVVATIPALAAVGIANMLGDFGAYP